MITIGLVTTSASLRRRLTSTLEATAWQVLVFPDVAAVTAAEGVDLLLVESSAVTIGRAFTGNGLRRVVLVDGDQDPYWEIAFRLAVDGLLDRDDRPEDLVAGICSVLEGRGWVSPELVPFLLARLRTGAVPAPRSPTGGVRLTSLTSREDQVARALQRGLSNTEIAQRLGIEPSTVKYHVSNILTKLGCRDRGQLIAALLAG